MIEYLFNYSYHSEASELSNELAIVFTTETNYLYIMNGDSNQDGLLNVSDIVLIVNFIVGQEELSDSQIETSDFNSDMLVDILDILQIIQIVLN